MPAHKTQQVSDQGISHLNTFNYDTERSCNVQIDSEHSEHANSDGNCLFYAVLGPDGCVSDLKDISLK